MSNHVDTVNVTVRGFGTELYVQSFELVVAVNTIPQINLNVLPIKSPKQGSGKYISASAPKIKDITALQKELIPHTLKLDRKATIEIEVVSKSDSEDEKNQKVTLRDWIFTDVGLSSIYGAGPAPVLTVTFCHPAVFLAYTGTIYEEIKNPLRLPEVFKGISGSDAISYTDNLYQVVAGGSSIEFYDIASKNFGGPTERYKSRVEQFRKDLPKHPPGKYIEGNTGGKLFLENVSSMLTGNIKIATGNCVMPRPFGSSTWNRLISTICADYLATIAPIYDKDRLKLEPFSPWQSSIYNINLPVVEAVEAQIKDPFPILGAAARKEELVTYHVINDHVRDNKDKTRNVEVFTSAFFFPKKALDEDTIGTILSLRESTVVANILSADRFANATIGHNGIVGGNLQDAGNGVLDRLQEDCDEAYTKAMYYIRYRAECKGVITTIPIFKDSGGNTIYPGRVLCLNSSDGELIYGYLTRLTVSGTTEGGAHSRFELSHIRPCDASNGLYVEEGTENPCYPTVNRQ